MRHLQYRRPWYTHTRLSPPPTPTQPSPVLLVSQLRWTTLRRSLFSFPPTPRPRPRPLSRSIHTGYASPRHNPQRAFTTAASVKQFPLSAFSPTGAVLESSISTAADDVLLGYIFGNNKATEVAHLVWRNVVRSGDIVIDATCGNGYDTLALLKMVADDDSSTGCVYGFDIQEQALRNTSLLLDDFVTPQQKQQVKLFPICHSRMEDVLPVDKFARLVAFNLGYLPGGEKSIITRPDTTLLALEAAKRKLAVAGLISAIVYVGHPGGRDEYSAVEDFASQLPVEEWNCSKLQQLNRPNAPTVVFISRK